MSTFESTITIGAPVEAVWSVLADVVAWPSWVPTVTAVEPLDGPELRPGARYRLRQPKLRPAMWLVTKHDPPRSFVWESKSPGIRVVGDHIVAEKNPGEASVVLRITYSGPLGSLVARVYGSLTASYVAQEAASLKRRVEADVR